MPREVRMNRRILITGSAGLVGTALRAGLAARGLETVGLDRRASAPGERADVRQAAAVRRALRGCSGVVHLAAVSRVVWGERDPVLCRSTNVGGTRTLLEAAAAAPERPWVLFASSREVYGQARRLPAGESTTLAPLNAYARTKVAGERLVLEARRAGLRTAVVRLSSIYGGTPDHADRVVPAFTAAAVRGLPLRVEGADHSFDFTHVDDVVRGLLTCIDLLREPASSPLPAVHLVSGLPTTLGELAALVVTLAGTRAPIVPAPARAYDVRRFWGDPERARVLLGWEARVPLRAGLARQVQAAMECRCEAP
jgi:nucleoside-diphosphate-sugar epimerase